ncbi:MAG: hypothetical protein JJE50_10400 [Actinomycetales bacterium]|nr:hypothetical protein [Actinomycetales bacterium]
MRIYLPATLRDLSAPDGVGARRAHALTDALRSALDDEDSEAGELAALLVAADASVRLIGSEGAPPRRLVIAADVAEGVVAATDGPPSAVEAPDVPWSAVVSFHVDDADDPEVADAVAGAAAGDPEAFELAAELDLLWYDVSEREDLRGQG